MNTESVDSFIANGCGRCDKYRTPDCKVHLWTDALVEMRKIVTATELVEEMKWGSPCYTLQGKNVVMVTALIDYCALSFFKGSLLTDPRGVLEAPGPNSQAARLVKFTSADQVLAQREVIEELLREAITNEAAGRTVEFKKTPEPIPEELESVLDEEASLRAAFEALTPGRKRSHILHVSGAKQSETRTRRARKCAEKIRQGKGFLDR